MTKASSSTPIYQECRLHRHLGSVKSIFPLRLSGYLVVAAAMVVFVLTATLLGQDTNWDLRNYHYYDGWAVFHEHASLNLWPAQIQTFHNPALSAFIYMLTTHLSPYGASICLGAIQSLNVPLVALIAHQTMGRSDGSSVLRLVAMATAVLIGATGPVTQTEIGTTLGDNLASIGILTAIASIGRFQINQRSCWVIAAGLAAGVATGLKLANGTYVLGIAISGWSIGGGLSRTINRSVIFAGSTALGFLIAYGCWGWHLWVTTGNPIFPYMNNVFHSSLAPFETFRDVRFLPASLLDAVSYPFQWALGRFPTSELPFRDLRFSVGWLVAPLAMCVLVAAHSGSTDPVRARFRTLLFFWTSSFCIWLAMFSYQRYVLPLELLSGIVIVESIRLLPRLLEREKAAVATVAAVIIAVTTRAEGYDRLPWQGDWFRVEVPADLARDDQMMVMLSHEPLAYVAPFFPATTRFVRLEGNLVLVPGTGLYKMAQSAIASHRGSFATLAPAYPSSAQNDLIAQFGLVSAPGPCITVTTRIERLLSCPLRLLVSSAGAAISPR